IWWAVKSNRQRPRSFWSPENLITWSVGALQRILPWKITRGPSSTRRNNGLGSSSGHGNGHGYGHGSHRQRRHPSFGSTSDNSYATTTHNNASNINGNNRDQYLSGTSTQGALAKKAIYSTNNLNSSLDTEPSSAGSGSETRSKAKTRRRNNNISNSNSSNNNRNHGTTILPSSLERQANASPLSSTETDSIPQSTTSTPPLPSSSSPSLPVPTPSTLAQSVGETSSSKQKTTTADTPVFDKEPNSQELSESATANVAYEQETADDNDNDFISTQDRRRRRKAKAFRTSQLNLSSESVAKPSSHRDQPKHEGHSISTTAETSSNMHAIQDKDTQKPATSMAQKTLSRRTSSRDQDQKQKRQPPGPSSSSRPVSTASTAATNPTTVATTTTAMTTPGTTLQSNLKEVRLSSPSLTPTTTTTTTTTTAATATSTFNHPLHALNSTSPIVRLKPTHARSQSAHLPASSPWSIPQNHQGGASSSGIATRPFQGSSLSQVSLPLAIDNTDAASSTTRSSSASLVPIVSTLTTHGAFSNLPPPNDLVRAESTESTASTSTSTNYEPGEYGLFGSSSSIWYSPFQSGLDISIEGEESKQSQPQQHEQHQQDNQENQQQQHQQDNKAARDSERSSSGQLSGNRVDQQQQPSVKLSESLPSDPLKSNPALAKSTGGSQKRPNLGPFLSVSPMSTSFFESSPRTPRIMPFSQHHQQSNSLEDWSVRARSSSIASPMTPAVESDFAGAIDYFSGSRSANNSRRGSIENNLTESLLSGRARMFALSDPSIPTTTSPTSSSLNFQQLQRPQGQQQQQSQEPTTIGFLNSSHDVTTGTAAAVTGATGSSVPLGSLQDKHGFPVTSSARGANTFLSDTSFLNSSTRSLANTIPGIFPTTVMERSKSLERGYNDDYTNFKDDAEGLAPVFVNPWDDPPPPPAQHQQPFHYLQSNSRTGSETFLPFGAGPSTSRLTNDLEAVMEKGRQSSLLQLMNGPIATMTAATATKTPTTTPPLGASSTTTTSALSLDYQRHDTTSTTGFGQGFLFPNRKPLVTSPPTSSSLSSSSSPLVSIESLAAAANQSPILTEDDPKYSFMEQLAMQSSDFAAARKRLEAHDAGFALGGAGTDGRGGGGGKHGGNGRRPNDNQQTAGLGHSHSTGGNKKQRGGARHGRTRSGHHKSASLGSFFPPTLSGNQHLSSTLTATSGAPESQLTLSGTQGGHASSHSEATSGRPSHSHFNQGGTKQGRSRHGPVERSGSSGTSNRSRPGTGRAKQHSEAE
ncbi:hypothetical protein BGZ94_006073, partial [Podila epigama]